MYYSIACCLALSYFALAWTLYSYCRQRKNAENLINSS